MKMRPCCFAMALTLLTIFSTPPCCVLQAARTPTTMDSLEAHVWSNELPESFTMEEGGVLFVMFRHNMMYVRTYENKGIWNKVRKDPFYFYTPGVESQTDIRVYYPDTIRMLRYKRVGKQPDGQHFVVRVSSGEKAYMKQLKHEHTLRSQIDYKELKQIKREGFAPLVQSFTVKTLTDSLLVLRSNNDYMERSPQRWFLHATTAPFPWDKNLKYFDYPVKEEEQEEEPQEKAGRKRRKKG